MDQPQLPLLPETRRSLHVVAELVLAGPQYRRSGTIRLRIVAGGFATIAEPDLRVEADHLIAGNQRLPIDGTTAGKLAAAAGVTPSGLDDVYSDGSKGTPHDPLRVDRGSAAYVVHCFLIGDEALRRLSADSKPVLWPEHFDVGITVDQVNYGVSPGDEYIAEPYAYVGPWMRREGEFWNAPFGAARTISELRDVDGVLAFFQQGRNITDSG
jgi:hypothetical protein